MDERPPAAVVGQAELLRGWGNKKASRLDRAVLHKTLDRCLRGINPTGVYICELRIAQTLAEGQVRPGVHIPFGTYLKASKVLPLSLLYTNGQSASQKG